MGVFLNSDGKLDPRQRELLLGLVLLFSFTLYANCLFGGFVFDDHPQVEQNPYVHSFQYLPKLLTTPMLANQGKQAAPNIYRPLTNILFLICFKLFGPSPLGFHLVNILLHCVVVLLVFLIGSRLFASDWIGLLAALIFAVHPVHSEPVAWINGVADPLMSALFLFAFWCYLDVGEKVANQRIGPMLALVISFALALFAKETAMVFPVLVILYEHLFRSDRLQTTCRTKLSRYAPVWIAFFAYLAVRVASVGRLVPSQMHSDITPLESLFSLLALIGQYCRKLLLPLPLIAFYPFQKSTSMQDTPVLLGALVTIALVLAFFALLRRAPLYSFAILWMGLTIAPTLNPSWMMAAVFAERYLYLPSVGFCWIAAGVVCGLWSRSIATTPVARWLIVGATALLLLVAGHETVARTFDWRSDRSLVVSTMNALPGSPQMHVLFGNFKWAEGDHEEAERQWNLALKLNPNSVEAIAYLGFAALQGQHYDQATQLLQRAIVMKPNFASPHIYLGQVYAAQQNWDAAESEFKRSLEIHPTNTEGLAALGQFYLGRKRLEEAAEQFRKSVGIRSEIHSWQALGQIYDAQAKPDAALDAWQHVLTFEPLNPQAHRSLGQIYLARKDWTQAQHEFQSCLLMDPHDQIALAGMEQIRLATVQATSPQATH